MADLTGKKIANTYKDLLQVNSSASNDGLDDTLRRVQDGSGKNSAISLSQSEAKIHGDLAVTGAISVQSINIDGLDVSAVNAVEVSATRINATSITTDKLDATTLVFQDVSVSSLRTGDLTAGTGTFTGAVSATSFYGDGSNLTGLEISTTAIDANTSAIVVNTSAIASVNTIATDAMPKAGGTFSGNVTFGDNNKANFGNSSDLEIYHDGSNSYIQDKGTGNLRIDGNTHVYIGRTSGYPAASFNGSGSSTLHYAGFEKLSTQNTGIKITGNVTATAFYGDGSNLTGIVIPTTAGDVFVSGQVHTTNGFKVSSSYPYVNFSETDTTDLNSSLISNDGKFKIGTAGDTFGNFNSRFEIDHQTGNATFSGNVSATAFYGDGSNLTGIVVPTTAVDANTSAIAVVSALTSVNAAAITSINTVLSAAQTSITANASAIASVNTIATDAMPKAGGTFTGQIQTNGNVSAKFYGPVDFNAYGIVVSSNASAVFNGPARFNSTISLGNSSDDLISTTGRFTGDLIPTTAVGKDLGNDSLRWDNAYINTFRGGINALGTSVTDLIYPSAYGNAPANVNYVTSAVAAKASVGTSATLETRIAGVSALTSVNAAAITSINNVVSALNSVVADVNASAIAANTSAIAVNASVIATVSALTSINAAAITSVNTIATDAMPKSGGAFTGQVITNGNVSAKFYGPVDFNNYGILVSSNASAVFKGRASFQGANGQSAIQLGNSSTQYIDGVARWKRGLIPTSTATYDFGNDSLRWNRAYITEFIGGINAALTSVSDILAGDDSSSPVNSSWVQDRLATKASVGTSATLQTNITANVSAIASVNTVLSAAQTSIAANASAIVVNTSAITSINTRINAVSVTMATSIDNQMPKIGGTFLGDVFFDDGISAKFGNPFGGGNLIINGNTSTLGATGTLIQGKAGVLNIKNDGNIKLSPKAGEVGIVITTNSAVDLYYNNSKKLATTSTGIHVSGAVSATSFYGDGSNLTGITAGASAGTSATLQTNINTVSAAVSANTSAIAALSATMATSISNHLPLTGGTVTGDVSFQGSSITLGNSMNDTIYGSGLFGRDIIPSSATDRYLGDTTRPWNFAYLGDVVADKITVSGAVSATSFYGDGSNLTGITAGASVGTSATLETRIAGVSALTSVNAINIAAVSALTSVNAAAITSINTVLSAAQTSITANASAIASVNTIATDAMPKAGGTFTGQIQTNGNVSAKFYGPVDFNAYGIVVSSNASAVFNGPARFYSAITLGNSSSDLIYTNGRFAGDLIPTTAVGRDLGTDSLRWDNAYINTLRGGINAIGTSVTDLTYPSAYGNAPANVNYVTSAVATKASVGTSVTLETRIAGVSALTSVNAINIAAVSALTSVNAAAITSINNVVSALNSVVAEVNTSAIAANAQAIAVANTSIAANASTVAINLAAITSVNNLAVANTSAIVSVNTIAVAAMPKAGGTFTGNVTFNNPAYLNNNIRLGNGSSDTITGSARWGADIIPNSNNTRALGSDSFRFAQVHSTAIFQAGVTVANTSVVAALSATMATSINNRTAAITSVNTRINAVSAIAVDALPKSGGLMTGDIRFNPTEKAIFQRYEVTAGSSANAFYEGLQIYSSGTRNFITASATGHEIDIKATSNAFIRAGNNTLNVTPTQIYLGGTAIFDGARFGGTVIVCAGNVEFVDNSKAVFGNGDDLQIYHDGFRSVIQEASGGELRVQANTLRLTNTGNNAYFTASSNGAAAMYHAGNEKLATTSTGIEVTGVVSATGDIVSGGNISGVTKSFDIEHPTKEGMRLHHGVLEGPEHAVYIRGKSSSSVIELPDYWEGLVYEDTITVQLTPVGVYDKLYVEEIKDNKVTVYNNSEYFYFIVGERKDIERFEVEYGDS